MSSLPPNWQEVTDPSSGRKYYFNTVTRVTSWTIPTSAPVGPPSLPQPAAVAPPILTGAPPPMAMSGEWKEVTSPDGRVYYFNTVTRVTSWTKPGAAPVGPPALVRPPGAPVGPPVLIAGPGAPGGPPVLTAGPGAPGGPPVLTAGPGAPGGPPVLTAGPGAPVGPPSFAVGPGASVGPPSFAVGPGASVGPPSLSNQSTPSIPIMSTANRAGPPSLNLAHLVGPTSGGVVPPTPTASAPPTLTSPPVLAALPPNWQATTSTDGRTYYFNTLTRETTWVRPGIVPPAPIGLTPPPGVIPPSRGPSGSIVPPPFRPSVSPPAFRPSSGSQGSATFNPVSLQPGAPAVGDWESPASSPAGLAKTQFFPTATVPAPIQEDKPVLTISSSPLSDFSNANRSREGNITHRYGLMKKYHPVFATLANQSGYLNVFEKDDRKKPKVVIQLNKCVVTPHTKGDKHTFVITEFDTTDKVNIDNVEGNGKDYYFAGADSAEVKAWIDSLVSNGARQRIPSWAGQTDRNKKPCYVEVYHNKILFYKASLDDDADIVMNFTSSTQFDPKPENAGIDYDYLNHGRITANTFRIMESGEDGVPIHFITCASSTEHENACDAVAGIVDKYYVRLAPDALIESYVFKANQAGTKWVRRYCIVYPNKLVYYKRKSLDDKPTEVNLPDGFEVRVIGNRDPTKPHQFRVSESGDAGTRHYFLCAVNKEAFDKWSHALLDLQKSKLIKKFEASVNEGYLFISSNGKKWSKKFFCLMEDKLLVFEARHNPKEILSYPLTGANIVSKSGNSSDTSVHVKVSTSDAEAVVAVANDDAASTTGVFSADSPDFVFSMVPNNDITAVRTYFATSSSHETDEWVKNIASLVASKNPMVYEDSVIEGYLLKANKKTSAGERRYFIIRNGKMYYLHTRNEDLAKAKFVDLPGDAPCFVVRDTNAPPHTFCIQTSGEPGAKAVYVNCTSDKERDEWINAIRKVKATRPNKRDPNSLIEGYIYKASTNGKNWSKRFVMVYNDRLEYFKTKSDQKVSGTIALPPGFIVNRVGGHSAATTSSHEGAASPAHNDDDDDEEYIGVVDDSKVISAAGSYFNTDASSLSLFYVAPSTDKDVRKFWMTCDDPEESQTWISLFKELTSTSSANRFPKALREGFLVVNAPASVASNRKYVVVYDDRIDVYKRKVDPNPESTVVLSPGFDYIVEEGDEFTMKSPIRVATVPSQNASVYTSFAASNASEQRSFYETLSTIYTKYTTKDTQPIVLSGYLYVEKAPFANPLINTSSLMARDLRFVVLSTVGFYVFNQRNEFYVNEARFTRGGVACIPSYAAAISTSVINEGTLVAEKLIVVDSGDTPTSFTVRIGEFTYTLSSRNSMEKQRWVNTARRTLQQAASNYGRVVSPVKNVEVIQSEPEIAPPPPEDDDFPPPPPPEFEEDDIPPPAAPPLSDDEEDNFVPKKFENSHSAGSSSASHHSTSSFTNDTPVRTPAFSAPARTGGLAFKPPQLGGFSLPSFDLPPPEDSLPPPPTANEVAASKFTPAVALKSAPAPVDDDEDSDDDAPPPAPVPKGGKK